MNSESGPIGYVSWKNEASIGWVNPFTGSIEAWNGSADQMRIVWESAALRINELQAEIDAIKEKMGDQQPS